MEQRGEVFKIEEASLNYESGEEDDNGKNSRGEEDRYPFKNCYGRLIAALKKRASHNKENEIGDG